MRVLLGPSYTFEAYEHLRLSRTGGQKRALSCREAKSQTLEMREEQFLNAHVHYNPLHLRIAKEAIPLSFQEWFVGMPHGE